MAFFLACLLALLSVASTKSPIFGPKQVTGEEGGSVSIQCFYPPTSVNRHDRKYFCLQNLRGSCETVVSSNDFVSERYTGRANLTNFPGNGSFLIQISQLVKEDTGLYKCGVGISRRGLSFDITLKVGQGLNLPNNTEVVITEVGKTVSINCPFQTQNAQDRKFLCKKDGESCALVIDSQEKVGPDYTGRARFRISGTGSKVFVVIISQIKRRDVGRYICGVGEDSATGIQKNVDLKLLEPEPELVYAEQRGSVTLNCDLGSTVASIPKFLCRMRADKTCDLVINSKGFTNNATLGRILLTPKTEPGSFSIMIMQVRKEDSGLYHCGAQKDGQPSEDGPVQALQIFVSEETTVPKSSLVLKGPSGGSVSITCHYNPKENNTLKYLCIWKGSSQCTKLVDNLGVVAENYGGRVALFDHPENGTFTVILNQLTSEDEGYYWCLSNGNHNRKSAVKIDVTDGQPLFIEPKTVTASLGQSLNISCHFPCKFNSYEKYWCKWSNQGCETLPTQEEGSSQAFVDCNQNSKIVSLALNPVKRAHEGWYWCGVKQGQHYGQTAAVYVSVEEASRNAIRPVNAVLNEDAVNPEVRGKVPEVPTDPGSTEEHSGGSTVLVSTLVPVALVLIVGAVALGVIRARRWRFSDRISVGSYRADLSMSDLENPRKSGSNDNMGASIQETTLGGEDEFITQTENPEEIQEPKQAKRSSKEEADMAYTTFLLQSNNMANEISLDGPSDA
ncbi:polymeric immunoglobulin receptor [Dromiciops gliroides]|uniref:polymeric immunoglobulin receptor n=1 Tax=Dromiciops gliroides TaxID=33562 RepID=UPI001CC40D39|nr:polymeric immunoglobulin receptor [Dromiciops gliroides]XP_043856056.1 polymeric immunoglobulin receptor [Dromiciops gliroides]